MEQLGFTPLSVKQTKWLALRLVMYTGVKLIGWSIVTWDRFKFLSALQIKKFGKSWFSMKYSVWRKVYHNLDMHEY